MQHLVQRLRILRGITRRGLMLACLLGFAVGSAEASPPHASDWPGDSVYQLRLSLTDQNGRAFDMDSLGGAPVLVSMFYTSCEFVCPMLVDTMRNAQAQLSAQERGRLQMLLVSIDPARDTVAVLQHTAQERELDAAQWRLARTEAPAVRKLAAVLGIQYRALPNGDFNHTTALILLDSQGRIVARSTQLGAADPEFVSQIRKTFAQGVGR
ncbi:MAG: SCO family protein [Curvibacter sp.]|nr:SCO family protein [Curvibacter sp.]